MKYRRFGSLDWESSILGMGVMRLPCLTEGGPGHIDQSESIRMIRYAIEEGVNYVDLGFPWDMARQERIVRVVREALEGGYREKVRVALTVPARLPASPGDFDLYLNRQLGWLESETVDFCLLGRLNRDNWPNLEKLGMLDRIDKAREDGRISAAGFFFHDHYQILKSIMQAYDRWALCQFQYSYMDIDHDPGVSGIRYAADRGLAVAVSEPLRGGRLAGPPSPDIERIWARSGGERSPAEWGLRFVWNHPGISTVICDMSNMEQLAENLRVAETAEADSLTVQEEVLIGQVRDERRKKRQVPCPSCRPCMPCPVGVDVPRFFEVYNDAAVYDDIETARAICRDEQLHPEDCTGCRLCESRCAKRLPIVDWLVRAREFLGVE
jgi:uncharacterized protein